MSSVNEMTGLCHEVADLLAPTGRWKDRVGSVSRAFGFGWNRAKDFYYGNARRVLSEEMDHARSRLSEIRAKRLAAEQHNRFKETIIHLRQMDEEFFGPAIAEMERSLLSTGDMDSPLDRPDE